MAWLGSPLTCGHCGTRITTEAEYNAHFTNVAGVAMCKTRVGASGVQAAPVHTKSPVLEYRGVQYLIAECHRCKKVRPLIEVGTTKRCRGCVWDLVQEVTKIHSTLQEAEAGGTKK